MFETIPETLLQFSYCAIFGFLLSFIYEILRLKRHLIPTPPIIRAGEDILYFSASGFFTFAFSMEIGIGHVRLYYLIGGFLGVILYFFTLGRLVDMINTVTARQIKRVLHFIYIPIRTKFVKIAQLSRKRFVRVYEKILILSKRLHKSGKKVYNVKRDGVTVSKNKEKGEERRVIIAKVKHQ